jgi:hypothetical protein
MTLTVLEPIIYECVIVHVFNQSAMVVSLVGCSTVTSATNTSINGQMSSAVFLSNYIG